MGYEPTYKTVEDATKAIDLGVEDTLRDNPDLKPQEDTIYHDIAQSVMIECSDDVARELARRTGVPRLIY